MPRCIDGAPTAEGAQSDVISFDKQKEAFLGHGHFSNFKTRIFRNRLIKFQNRLCGIDVCLDYFITVGLTKEKHFWLDGAFKTKQ